MSQIELKSEATAQDDALTAKGRIVSEYSEVKTRLARLKGTAVPLIGKLQALANQLNHYESAPVNYGLEFLKTDFQALMNDLQKTEREKANLEQKLRNLGIDVKIS